MIRFTPRQVAATMILAASAALTSSFAQETPAAAPYAIPPKTPDVIKKAIQSPARQAQMTARDVNRRPADVLALAGVKRNANVIEFASYDLYYTQMLSEIVGEKGKVYKYDPLYAAEEFSPIGKAFVAEHPNVIYENVDYGKLEPPRGIDIVLSVGSYHDLLLTGADTTVFNSKLFKAMKPGAIYLVVEHSAKIGTESTQVGPLHRMDPAYLRQDLQSAGFQLMEESRIFYRPETDDRTWNSHTPGKEDLTDQTVFKFRKPIVY